MKSRPITSLLAVAALATTLHASNPYTILAFGQAGGGDPIPNAPSAAYKFVAPGVPAFTAEAAAAVFKTTFTKASPGVGTGIFFRDRLVATNEIGSVLSAAPGLPGVRFTAFGDPMPSANYSCVFTAALAGTGITAANNRVVIYCDYGLLATSGGAAPHLFVVARTGDIAPDETGQPSGNLLKAFDAVSLSAAAGSSDLTNPVEDVDAEVMIRGRLAVNQTTVIPSNSSAVWLWRWTRPGTPTFREALRGNVSVVGGSVVKSYDVLGNAGGLAGECRSLGQSFTHSARVIFQDGKYGILGSQTGNPPATGLAPLLARTGQAFTYGTLAGGSGTGTLQTVGVPSGNFQGHHFYCFTGVFSGVIGAAKYGVWAAQDGTNGLGLTLLARGGDPAPVPGSPGALFNSFTAIANERDSSSFLATLTGALTGSIGLFSVNTNGLSLVAQKGASAPEVSLSEIQAFESIADLGGGLTLYRAKMKSGPLLNPGPGSVLAADDRGLWVCDAVNGAYHKLVLREGDTINAGGSLWTLVSFDVLGAVPQGGGVMRAWSHDPTGTSPTGRQVIVRLNLATGKKAIARIAL